jgi:hypothetical protein
VYVRAGVLLIVLALLCWLAIPLVPFAGMGGGATAAAIGGLVVLAEIVFWIGVVLIGRETWRLTREQGWRRLPAELWGLLRYGRRPVSRE